VNHTGLIDVDELANAIKKIHMDIPLKEIEEIMSEVNFLGNGEINYSEFIAATLSVKSMLTNEKLYALFKELDHDGIDVLTS
jgi:calcium-dependent protein kinase